MATAKRNKKIKQTFHVEPLAVGHNSRSQFLLLRRTSLDSSELRIIFGNFDTKFTGTSYPVKIIDSKKKLENTSRCHSFRFSTLGTLLVMTYIRQGQTGASLVYATSRDKKKWTISDVITKVRTAAAPLPVSKKDTPYLYFGDHVLKIVRKKKTRWEVVDPPRVPHWHFFEGVPFSVAGATFIEDVIAVVYSAEHTVDILQDVSLRDEKIGEEKLLKIGVAMFAKDMPTRLLWQTELPALEIPLETHGRVTMLGVVVHTKKKKSILRLYTASDNGEIGFVDIASETLFDLKNRKQIQLIRSHTNPIVSPTAHLDWEKDGTFNPTALELNGKIHLLYRAAGADGMSKIGYASSRDGIHIDERLKDPIYTPRFWFEYVDGEGSRVSQNLFASGGTWGGCEDPKVTVIDNRVYMTYVAHTGVWPTRTVLTSLSVDDFLHKRWKWSKPQLMSPPGVGSKSVVILPEKIDGKYVVFHRRWPNIMVDFVDHLDFGEGKQWLTGQHMIRPRKSFWDSQKLSLGAAPIKTKDGWLAIYNAVDRMDSGKYKIGVMLLDLHHPEKVIARSRRPILSPEESYENDGKPGVTYPGGAILRDGILYVYYGGGDKVSCVAQIPIEELLFNLKKDSEYQNHITRLSKIKK